MKETILLYTGIYSWTAEDFVSKVLAIDNDKELVVRFNTGGGGVYSGNSMITVLSEHEGTKIAKVDGIAASMGTVMLPYFDKVISSPLAQFMIHRADGYVRTDEEKASLANLNANFRAKLEAKIDIEAFEKMKGVKFSKIFDAEERLTFYFTAKEAKKIKLVDEIKPLSKPEKKKLKASISERSIMARLETNIAASLDNESDTSAEVEKNKQIKNNKTMTKETLKAENSVVYNEILALGVAKEQTRVKAWLAYQEIDPVAVSKGISEGADVDVAVMASMQVAAFKKTEVAATKTEGVEAVVTAKDNTEKTTEQIEASKVEADVYAELGISKEIK